MQWGAEVIARSFVQLTTAGDYPKFSVVLSPHCFKPLGRCTQAGEEIVGEYDIYN
jgi:hypothetical protein